MKNLALFLCFLCPFLVQGHAGGHYSSGDLLKIWHLQNGQKVEGNFAYGNSETMTVEQLHGKLQTILLADLQSKDRKIAQIKINRYETINGFGLNSQPGNPPKPSFWAILWVVWTNLGFEKILFEGEKLFLLFSDAKLIYLFWLL